MSEYPEELLPIEIIIQSYLLTDIDTFSLLFYKGYQKLLERESSSLSEEEKKDLIEQVIIRGDLDLFIFMVEDLHFPIDQNDLMIAVSEDQLDIVKYYFRTQPVPKAGKIIPHVNSIEMFEYLEKIFPIHDNRFIFIVRFPMNMKFLTYLYNISSTSMKRNILMKLRPKTQEELDFILDRTDLSAYVEYDLLFGFLNAAETLHIDKRILDLIKEKKSK